MAAMGESSEEQSEAAVIDCLVEARHRGAPCFAAGNALALEMLTAIAATASTAALRTKAKSERRIWSNRGRRRVRVGPFFAWENANPAFKSGKLSPHQYSVLFEGAIDGETFEVGG